MIKRNKIEQITGNLIGDFYKVEDSFKVFIKTKLGIFLWNDPYFGGDNIIRPVIDDENDSQKLETLKFDGRYFIKDFCGSKFKITFFSND